MPTTHHIWLKQSMFSNTEQVEPFDWTSDNFSGKSIASSLHASIDESMETTDIGPPSPVERVCPMILMTQNVLASRTNGANAKQLETAKKPSATPKKDNSKSLEAKVAESSENNAVPEASSRKLDDINMSLLVSQKLQLSEEASNKKAETEIKEAYNYRASFAATETQINEPEQFKSRHADSATTISESDKSVASDEDDALFCCSGGCSNSDLRNIHVDENLNVTKTRYGTFTTEYKREQSYDMIESNESVENEVTSYPNKKNDHEDDSSEDNTSNYGAYGITKQTAVSKKENKTYFRSDIKTDDGHFEYNNKMQTVSSDVQENQIKTFVKSETGAYERRHSLNWNGCEIKREDESAIVKENGPKTFASPAKAESKGLFDWSGFNKFNGSTFNKESEPRPFASPAKPESKGLFDWSGFNKFNGSTFNKESEPRPFANPARSDSKGLFNWNGFTKFNGSTFNKENESRPFTSPAKSDSKGLFNWNGFSKGNGSIFNKESESRRFTSPTKSDNKGSFDWNGPNKQSGSYVGKERELRSPFSPVKAESRIPSNWSGLNLADGSSPTKENVPKSFVSPKSENRRLSDSGNYNIKMTPTKKEAQPSKSFNPIVGYERRHSSWTGSSIKKESSLYNDQVQKSPPVFVLKKKSAVLDSIVSQTAPVDSGRNNNQRNSNDNCQNKVSRIAFVTFANRSGIEALVKRLLAALEDSTKNLDEMAPEAFLRKKHETINEESEFEDDPVEVVPGNSTLNNPKFNAAALPANNKPKNQHDAKEKQEEKGADVQKDESVCWIPIKQSVMPRTSSLLSMASRLSATESPAISPIKRRDSNASMSKFDSLPLYRRGSSVAKPEMRFNEEAVVDSETPHPYEALSRIWMNQAGKYSNDFNSELGNTYKKQPIRRRL